GGIAIDDTVNTMVTVASNKINNFAQEWKTLTNSGASNIVDICCSGDGRVVFVGKYSAGASNSRVSRDYGQTWEDSPSGNTILRCSASLDGKYIVVNDFTQYKISSDYGKSFESPWPRPLQFLQSAISATGKYIAAACTQSQGLQVSTNFGSTWTVRETTVWTWNDICISLDGSVIYACSDNGLIKKSVDYGQTWTTVYNNNTQNITRITCSGDGTKVLACLGSSSQLLLSLDAGVSFNSVGSSYSYYKVAMSSNGLYMLASVIGSRLVYSTNGGVNWQEVLNNKMCAIAVNSTGDILYNVPTYENVIVSEAFSTHFSTAQPLIANAGSTYFDVATNKLYIYNGSAWKSVTLA
ncbi:MAG: WD40/YVTN/BNR-like repeat-containing protein, partial [Dolichospermum sp.]